MGSLFGGSKSSSNQTSESYNQYAGYLKDAFSPQVTQGNRANNAIAALLGVGGNPAAASNAFNQFLGSSGYQFQLDQGNRAITSNAATRGLLNSGATLKASQKFGQGLGSAYFQQYLQNLGGLTATGQNAGQIISGAGQVSKSVGGSSSKANNGIGDLIGGILGFAFSDERLKKNMRHWATDKNGIRYYTWDWNEKARKELGLEGSAVGVSAQELRGTPWEHAAVKSKEGYDKVAYALLPDPIEKEAA